MSKSPKVSVVSISYNQEKYIRQTLESFVMQKTNFDFEVVIADDGSTDKTQAIIKEFADTHPAIIKPILRKKNVGVQNNLIDALKNAKGEYIALCEGDDYWTNPKKLQIQADYLDDRSDYALCFHPVRVFFEKKEEPDYLYPSAKDKKDFTINRLFAENFIQTNSVMYRRQKKYDQVPNDILPLDWYLHLYHARMGKIGFIDGEAMSAYRRQSQSIWWDAYQSIDKIWLKYGMQHLRLYLEMERLAENQKGLEPVLEAAINRMLINLMETDEKHGTAMFADALRVFPEVVQRFAISTKKTLAAREAAFQKLEATFHAVQKDKNKEVAQLQGEISAIKSSRIWRFRNSLAKLVGKEVI